MLDQIFLFVRNLALRAGVALSRMATKDEILGSIRRLAPIETEHQLVRIGGSADGGYLVPNDLQGLVAVFSPGVAETADFELHFAKQGLKCYLIDGSVEESPVRHPKIHFEKKWLSAKTDDDSISLNDWVNEFATHGDLLLQIDIEGAEYEALLSASSETLRKFRIIVMEIHDLQSVFSRSGNRLIKLLISRLLDDFYIVHTHVNNASKPITLFDRKFPELLELTLHRKDRVKNPGAILQGPHPLDAPNTGNRDWQMDWRSF